MADGPELNALELFAHARNHVRCELAPKSTTAIVLSDVDFRLKAVNLGDLAVFVAILATFSLRMRSNGYL